MTRPSTFARRLARHLWLAAVLVVVLEMVSEANASTRRLLPAPTSVVVAWWRLLASGDLVRHAAASLGRVTVGYILAALLALMIGLLASRTSPVGGAVRTVVELLRPIPPIAWVPLAILWFGLGDASATFIVLIGAFFPICVSTADAVGGVDSRYIEVARTLGVRRAMLVTNILVPGALPSIVSGLRVGLGIAWTSVIAAELVGTQSGLGYLIQQERLLLQGEELVATMATIGLLGYALAWVTRSAEHRVLVPWSAEDRASDEP